MGSYVVGVDAGKTRCRVGVSVDGHTVALVERVGVAPTPDREGLRRVAASIGRAVDEAIAKAHKESGDFAGIAVGVAGVTVLPGGAASLADALSSRWPGVSVAVTGDSVLAHAGALDGRSGVVLAVGTGVIALGLAADGDLRRVDGWGQWLGDDGSGAWIGREALRAVARAADGRGDETTLSAAAADRYGDIDNLAAQFPFDRSLPTRTAAFAPEVFAAAERGDAVAVDIVARAADAWTDCALVAVRAVDARDVACVGGLSDAAALRNAWEKRVTAHAHVVPAVGNALDGAYLLARRTDLPHEAQVSRVVGASGPGRRTEDLDVLATEGVRPDLDDLDVRSTEEIVDVLLDAESELPAVLDGVRRSLTDAVAAAERALRAGARIVYLGAGTPGRLAALDAAECPPTFGVDPERVIAVLAGGSDASARAVEGAEDRGEDAVTAIAEHHVTEHDVVIGISASGRTPFVLAGLRAAKERGATTVGVVNNPDSVIAANADIAIELLTGAEVVSGSTRLTAGTAQKVTLNTLSTAAMVRVGKTYGPRMVDVVASNHKLRKRASRIVREVCAVDDDVAVEALEAARWRTKVAIVMLLAEVDVADAETRLDAADGRVRAAVDRAG